MKPVLRRSALFWLGLAVLLFLGGAWVDSRRTTTSFYKVLELDDPTPMSWSDSPAKAVLPTSASYVNGATLHDGKLILCYASASKLKPHVTKRYEPLTSMRIAPDDYWQVPSLNGLSYFHNGANLADVRRHRLALPMWGLVGAFAVAWGAVLVWRGWEREEEL